MTVVTAPPDRIQLILDDLGSTPDAVANRLRALGIKGEQGSACDCPIARLLLQAEQVKAVEVDAGDIRVVEDGHPSRWVRPPAAVDVFIHLFDEGVYLDLVDPLAGTR